MANESTSVYRFSSPSNYTLTKRQGIFDIFESPFLILVFPNPNSYNGSSNPISITTSNNITFDDPTWWTRIDGTNTWNLTVIFVDGVVTSTGSLKLTFTNNNKPIETFEAIPGELNTSMLEKGDYADISIPIIFNKLKNGYAFPDSIVDDIKYKLAAFFVSIALQQRISERIELLLKDFIENKISLEQFNSLVKEGNEEFAKEYATNYVNNYLKLEVAIEKYRYLLKSD